MTRDLGLRERVLRDVARTLGGELGVDRLLKLDLDLREPAFELLAIALGVTVLLAQPLAIGLDLLELDANILDVAGQPHHVVGTAATARLIGLGLDEQPAEPAVLFFDRRDLRTGPRRRGRRLVALGLELADLLERLLLVGAQLLDDFFLRDQTDAALFEHPLLLVDDLAQVLDLGELLVELLPALVLGPRQLHQLAVEVLHVLADLDGVFLRARRLTFASGHVLGHLAHLVALLVVLVARLLDLVAQLIGDAIVCGRLLLAILDRGLQLLDPIAQRRRLGTHALAVGDLALVARVRLLELGLERLDLGGGLLGIELEPEIDHHLLLGILGRSDLRRTDGTAAAEDAGRALGARHLRRTAVGKIGAPPAEPDADGNCGGPPYGNAGAAPASPVDRRIGHRGCRHTYAGAAEPHLQPSHRTLHDRRRTCHPRASAADRHTAGSEPAPPVQRVPVPVPRTPVVVRRTPAVVRRTPVVVRRTLVVARRTPVRSVVACRRHRRSLRPDRSRRPCRRRSAAPARYRCDRAPSCRPSSEAVRRRGSSPAARR